MGTTRGGVGLGPSPGLGHALGLGLHRTPAPQLPTPSHPMPSPPPADSALKREEHTPSQPQPPSNNSRQRFPNNSNSNANDQRTDRHRPTDAMAPPNMPMPSSHSLAPSSARVGAGAGVGVGLGSWEMMNTGYARPSDAPTNLYADGSSLWLSEANGHPTDGMSSASTMAMPTMLPTNTTTNPTTSATNNGNGNANPTTNAKPTTSSTSASAKRKKTKKDVFACPEPDCGKTFPRSFALRRHMRIHTGTKPYVCDYEGCSQRFNTSGNLSRHKRIHSGERPYPCIFATCGKKFNTSTKLKRHMRIHFPEGQNVFRCVGLNCSWSCDNYKEFAAHQKLQHNIIVGAGLEAASAAAAAAAAANANANANVNVNVNLPVNARGNMEGMPGENDRYEALNDHAFPATTNLGGSYLYSGYPKHVSAPSMSMGMPSNRRLVGQYDMGYATLPGGLPRDGSKKMEQDHGMYTSNASVDLRRGKQSSYALNSAFPPADVAAPYGRAPPPASLYETASSLGMASSDSYGPPLRAGLPSHFPHSLRGDDNIYKTEEGNTQAGNAYDHAHHPPPVAHHHILRPPLSNRSNNDPEGLKTNGLPPPMHPAAPEFTGEELSVVLELMNSSY